MTSYRRITFQLASLLDLLLIVMFSQYLEVQIRAERQSQQLAGEQETSRSELDDLRQQLVSAQEKLRESELQHRESDRIEVENLEVAGRAFGEMFRVPRSVVQQIVNRRSQDSSGITPNDAEALKRELRELAASRGDQVVDHLLTYVEMKKRFDVWELYVQENGAIVVTAASHQKRLQTGVVQTSQQFADELFRIYKEFPQTKSIVLILVSYGDARFAHRTIVIKGLPLVTERMRADSNDTTRFEYAVLGYRPVDSAEH